MTNNVFGGTLNPAQSNPIQSGFTGARDSCIMAQLK